MKIALVVALLAAGCRSEGGVEFSYALYREGSPPAPALNCSVIDVSRVRFMVGTDANGDRLLDDDELEGRATLDCNQVDRDSNQMLAAGELGSFVTADDRLPAGAYNAFAIELALLRDNVISNVESRYPTVNSYADRWVFSQPDGQSVVVIEENAITHVDFSTFDGGFPELRLIVR